MRKYILVFVAVLFFGTACDTLNKLNLPTNVPVVLTDSEIVGGLKEALNVGTNNAVGLLGKVDGFLKSPVHMIPFPEEATRAKDKLENLGMGTLIDNFISTMNHGAENAVSKAGPIFLNAITSMTITDAVNILKGTENAATEYFKQKTTASLTTLFKPEITKALDAVHATKYWTDITSTYNKIPFVAKVETDLSKYVTEKALNALFSQIAAEEKKIRTDPVARVSDILKKVFDPNAIVQ